MDGALAEPSSLLHAELADGLHAMAQPLTILRGAMCALTLREEMEPANRRYLDMSAKQVDRLCDLMAMACRAFSMPRRTKSNSQPLI